MKRANIGGNLFDLLKHISTLSTGSLVLLATFAEKFPKDAKWKPLLGFSMAAFLIAVLSSVVTSFVAIVWDRYENKEKISKAELEVGAYGLGLIVVSFFLGLAFLGAFAFRNFAYPN